MKASAKQTIQALEHVLSVIDKAIAANKKTIRPIELMIMHDDIRAIQHTIEAIRSRYTWTL